MDKRYFPWVLTEQQQQDRAKQEAAMRNYAVRKATADLREARTKYRNGDINV